MITILSALASLLSFRLRGRTSLELELVALRHQVMVVAADNLIQTVKCPFGRLSFRLDDPSSEIFRGPDQMVASLTGRA
jgi:hypothetical protein